MTRNLRRDITLILQDEVKSAYKDVPEIVEKILKAVEKYFMKGFWKKF